MVKVLELWIFSHGNLYSVDRINNYRNQKLFQRTCGHVSFGLTSLENPTPAVPALTYSLA